MLPYLIQPLAQWMGRPVTSREVVGSSPTRPTEHGMVPRCYRSLLVVAYVTVWARVVGLRASRWACYCVSIVPSRPPGLAGFSARGGILVDTLDLGSSVLRGVWVRVPPGALAAEVFGVSSCRSCSTRVMMGGTRFAGLTQLVECSSCKRDVGGSSPPSGSGVDCGA